MFEFKGKRENGEWIESKSIIHCEDGTVFLKVLYKGEFGVPLSHLHKIDPATLCVHWGAKDANKAKVFSSDLLIRRSNGVVFVVEFDSKLGHFILVNKDNRSIAPLWIIEELEIIGNEFDHVSV